MVAIDLAEDNSRVDKLKREIRNGIGKNLYKGIDATDWSDYEDWSGGQFIERDVTSDIKYMKYSTDESPFIVRYQGEPEIKNATCYYGSEQFTEKLMQK
jgi:hypothetical protein